MEAKIGITSLLSKYHFTINEEKTPKNLEFHPRALALTFKQNVYMNVRKV